MKKYEFIIFDLDDTIFDFQHTQNISLQKVFEKFNMPFNDETYRKYKEINVKMWTKLEDGLISKEELLVGRFKEFFNHYGFDIDANEVEDEYRSHINKGHHMLPNAFDTLKKLKENEYKIFAGTNGLSKTQRMRLSDSKLIELFDDIFISDELGFEKPHKNFFKIIFDKYPNMNKLNTLMVGDTPNSDIKGAYEFGIDSVLIKHFKDIPNSKATYEIDRIEHILDILI